jgi:RNA recognition motif-containing protein
MNIYVGNIPRDSVESDVRNIFTKYGEISNITMVRDKFTSMFKGFAFVEMPNKAEAEKAINGLNGTTLGGRQLTVNEAKPKGESSSRTTGYNRY